MSRRLGVPLSARVGAMLGPHREGVGRNRSTQRQASRWKHKLKPRPSACEHTTNAAAAQHSLAVAHPTLSGDCLQTAAVRALGWHKSCAEWRQVSHESTPHSAQKARVCGSGTRPSQKADAGKKQKQTTNKPNQSTVQQASHTLAATSDRLPSLHQPPHPTTTTASPAKVQGHGAAVVLLYEVLYVVEVRVLQRGLGRDA